MSEFLSDLRKAQIDFPNLSFKNLLLNRLQEDDVEAIYQYASDPQTVEWVSWQRHQDRQDTFRFLQSIENCLNIVPPQAFLTWGIRLKSKPELAIGAIHFSQFSEISGQIDFVLGKEYWNQGITTETLQHLVAWIFLKFPKIRRIQCHCVEEHQASRRVMEKSGLKFEGIRRDGIQMKSNIYNLAIYAVVREDAVVR